VHPSWIQEFALKILGMAEAFWAAIEPALKSDVQELLAQIMPLAVAAVSSLATDSSKSGAQKRDAAYSQIASAAEAAGISAGASVINTAIELAVQQVNAAVGGSATAAADSAPLPVAAAPVAPVGDGVSAEAGSGASAPAAVG
jgi:hypothetical protein